MKSLLLSLACLALSAGQAWSQTVILVRHAEKTDASAEAGLTPAGLQRARALADALAGARLTRVLVSPAPRTRLTAEPAARAAGLTPEAVSLDGGGAAHVRRTVDAVRAAGPDAVILVVGHSNTVPAIVGALTGAAPVEMPDCEHDRLTVVRLFPGGASAVQARYGAPSTC